MASLRQLFLRHVAQTSDMSMCIDVHRASGVYIYGSHDKKYLDFNSGISVSSLGHGHPEVVQAVQEQAATYMHTMVYGEHIQTPQVAYASLISKVLDDSLDNIYFVNSGSEAVEAAMKLVRKATGRIEIISCAGAYHGSTIGAESLRSDYDFSRHYFPTIPGIRHIRFNREEDLNKITHKTAAVILEPVQAEGGIIRPENDYLMKIRERCSEVGALFILDEIQTGFGRTGAMFAHQKFDIIPDILLLAKAMGGGMPIGALVAPRDLMRVLAIDPPLGHITTFGGHPVCVAAALATLRVLLHQDIILHVREKEALIHAQLHHPLIEEIRSEGLMMAVKLKRPELLSKVISAAIEEGVLVDYFLFCHDAFRIAPPLVISPSEIMEGIHKLYAAMDRVVREESNAIL